MPRRPHGRRGASLKRAASAYTLVDVALNDDILYGAQYVVDIVKNWAVYLRSEIG